ncbi:MAG: hypothetical protein HYY50_04220 [Candidatus Kerfeldbacteria bacterium]|nr:hypothetical protein [Candidatus Kerfeldbacteria bacterium]
MTHRPGLTLTPVLIAFLAVVAFLVVLNFSIPAAKQSASTNRNTSNTSSYVPAPGHENVNEMVVVNANSTNVNTNVANVNAPSDLTAGWTTYSNSTLGYSIQYPPDWTQSVVDDAVLIVPPETVVAGYAEGSIRLLVQKVPTISTDLVTNSSNITINGLSATQQTEGGLRIYTATYFQKGNEYVQVIYEQDANRPEFPLILTSFAFTQ